MGPSRNIQDMTTSRSDEQPIAVIHVREMAQRLGRSKNHVYLLLAAGIIRSIEYGTGTKRRRRLVLRRDFEKFIEGA